MINAAIFDMDGLMINTEPLQSKAYETILKDYGILPQYYPSGVIQKVGVREKDNWELIKSSHNFTESTDVLIEKRKPVYLELLKAHVIAQPGLLSLLTMLKTHQIRLAVASSSHKHQIQLVLEGLGLKNYFSVIISGEDVVNGKPFPDIFLKAAEQLTVKPQNCVVFEDAQTGVEAGRAAGMKVIAVPNEFTSDQDMSQADKIVPTLEKVTWETIAQLFE